jgi:hypothetical protein
MAVRSRTFSGKVYKQVNRGFKYFVLVDAYVLNANVYFFGNV